MPRRFYTVVHYAFISAQTINNNIMYIHTCMLTENLEHNHKVDIIFNSSLFKYECMVRFGDI